jgi:predicted lipoprotein with Yx(FWY)xxD motif
MRVGPATRALCVLVSTVALGLGTVPLVSPAAASPEAAPQTRTVRAALPSTTVPIGATGNAAPHTGTEVSAMSTSAYGSVLVWGGTAEGAGSPLYEFSGDANGKFGCTTREANGYDAPQGSFAVASCTGPESDFVNVTSGDDWPAFTTTGAPVAGPGVEQKLLGTVDRPGIGDQVTYGGHPLYLFDAPSKPFTPEGEGYLESVAPMYPWHGIWYLVSARDGRPAPGPTAIGPEVLANKKAAVAYVEFPAATHGQPMGSVNLPVTVYSYSLDRRDVSACTGACVASWLPLLTTGRPQTDNNTANNNIAAQDVGVMSRPDGTEQVTYLGKPLYLYSGERYVFIDGVELSSNGTAGNGNGLHGPNGGTFSVVYLGR